MYLPSDLPSWLALLVIPVPLFLAGATWTPTDQSRRMSTVVSAALAAAGLNRKTAADRARLDEAELSRQLNDLSPLSLSRLADLGDAFWRWFHLIDGEQRGLIVLRQRDVLKRMAKAGLREEEKDKTA